MIAPVVDEGSIRTAGSARRVLAKAARAGMSQTFPSRSVAVTFGLFFLLPPLVLGGLWKVAAESAGGSIAGYGAGALVWYIAASETAVLTVRNRLIEDIGDDVASERITVELIRPTTPLSVRLAMEYGFMMPRLALGIGLSVLVGLTLGGPPGSVAALALAVPALLLALALNLTGQYVFAAGSFWLREAKGAWFLYNKLVFVLGGMLLPLEVLPQWMEAIAKSLPFMAMAYVPARLAAGHFEPQLLALQVLWLSLALIVAGTAFRRGQDRMMRAEL